MEINKEGTIRLASTVIFDSIVDGPNLRAVIYTQGCSHNCKSCHNPTTHSYTGGKLFAMTDIVNEIAEDELNDGVTFSGGDPFEQARECLFIVSELKKRGRNDFWAYTGYTWEELTDINSKSFNQEKFNFLKELDVLVDGKFVEELKGYDLIFKGSSNQRLIDVQKSFEAGEVVLW